MYLRVKSNQEGSAHQIEVGSDSVERNHRDESVYHASSTFESEVTARTIEGKRLYSHLPFFTHNVLSNINQIDHATNNSISYTTKFICSDLRNNRTRYAIRDTESKYTNLTSNH